MKINTANEFFFSSTLSTFEIYKICMCVLFDCVFIILIHFTIFKIKQLFVALTTM